MSTLAIFDGIVIIIHPRDHVPPHFHAKYSGQEASFNFEGEIIAGLFPRKQAKKVAKWALSHYDLLNENCIGY